MLVDEHPLWLEAVQQVLEREGIEVVGKTTSLPRSKDLVAELKPDLIVAELTTSEPETDGLGWLSDVRRRFPDLKVIVLSTAHDPARIAAVMRSGAVAYVVKRAHPDDLAVAVRQAYDHSIYLPSFVRESEDDLHPDADHPLTRRELEILRLAADGHSNAALARTLFVTEQTVKFHLSNIYRKLGVSNRTEASRWAQLHGLLQGTTRPHDPTTAGKGGLH